jgi:hypothetical protein
VIRIRYNAMPLLEAPVWKWRDGDRYCLILSDIGMYQPKAGKFTAEPFYRALFEATKTNGQLVIWMYFRKTHVLMLSKRPRHVEFITYGSDQ